MPRIRIRNAVNSLQTVKQIRVRDENNVLRVIQRVRVRDAGNFLRTVFESMVASVNPVTVSGSFTGSPPATSNITTGSVTALVAGGTSPFTKAWTLAEPAPYTWTITSPTASSTTFTAANVESGVQTSARFRITLTDANGVTASAVVTAIANNQSSVQTSSGTGGTEPEPDWNPGPPTQIP